MEKQLFSNELEDHEVIYAQDYEEDVAREHFMDCQVHLEILRSIG